VDPERERISLGIKQMEQDPFGNFTAEHAKGSIVTGVITSVDAKGAVVLLADGVEGFLKANELSRERVEDARTLLNEGESIEAKFIGIDRKNRSILLSIKAKENQEEQDVMRELNRSDMTSPTLGDLLKEQMDSKEK
jgi:small subunit ribosomal protein S1